MVFEIGHSRGILTNSADFHGLLGDLDWQRAAGEAISGTRAHDGTMSRSSKHNQTLIYIKYTSKYSYTITIGLEFRVIHEILPNAKRHKSSMTGGRM